MRTHFQPQIHAVENLIGQGLTILAGSPKIGKSFLALDLAQSVAKGEAFLGRETAPGDVLYLALEDSEARLQRRSAALGHSISTNRLSFCLRAPTLRDGLISLLARWTDKAASPRMILIDTLQCVRGDVPPRMNAYASDYMELNALKAFADERRLSIVCVHHLRKASADGGDDFDRISGSNGLSGAADTMILMSGTRGEQTAVLKIVGRDVESDDIPLQRAGAKWAIVSQETAERAKYEKHPLVPIMRELKREMFAGKVWNVSYEDFAQTANRIAGAPLFDARSAGKELRALSGDLLRFDGIVADEIRLGKRRAVRFKASDGGRCPQTIAAAFGRGEIESGSDSISGWYGEKG